MTLAERLTQAQNAVDGLTALANNTTSAGDTNITDAISSLIAGYAGGGLPSGIRKMTTGSFKLDADVGSAGYTIEHGLGVTPDLIILTSNAEESGALPSNTSVTTMFGLGSRYYPASFTGSNCYFMAKNVSGVNASGATSGMNNNDGSFDVINDTIAHLKLASNRRLCAKWTYTWTAIKMA